MWLLVKRDYRLPIAKRFGPTAARTFDMNATEIVTIGVPGVSTFRHFSQSTLSTACRLRESYTFDIAIHFYEWQAAHIANLDAIFSFAVIFIYRIYVREWMYQFTILNADFLIAADVQLKMNSAIESSI